MLNYKQDCDKLCFLLKNIPHPKKQLMMRSMISLMRIMAWLSNLSLILGFKMSFKEYGLSGLRHIIDIRRALCVCTVGIGLTQLDTDQLLPPAFAFENALPNNFKMPKSKGPQPTNLGVDKNGLLRKCLKPSPNCFSTTPDNLDASANEDDEDDDDGLSVGDKSMNSRTSSMWGDGIHYIPRWKYTQGTADDAYKAIGDVLEAYVPYHDNIDGGGFMIVKHDSVNRYYYIQYESLKRGYIDDVEIKVDNDGTIQVISSSRLGYLDFQVNAKRLNYIASLLRNKPGIGFVATEITSKSHPEYFEANPSGADVGAKGDGFGKKKY